MKFLADASWLVRLERELRGVPGPALALLELSPWSIFINPISNCEFLSAGAMPWRHLVLRRLNRLAIDYRDSILAARLRLQRAKIGKSFSTPDAFMAACAINHHLRLLTADKDFSGIPGLDWSSYRTEN